jgi:hypothetical protein
VLAAQPSQQRLALPAEQWDWCVEVSRTIVARIEKAGYEVNGNLADLMPGLALTADLHCPSEAEVATAGVEAIASMLEDRYQRTRRSRRQRAAELVTSQRHTPPPGGNGARGMTGRIRASAGRLARRVRG